MYSVYCDDILIHDSTSPADQVHLISPNLKMGDCAAGSFEATIPPGNAGYNNVERMTSTIIVKKEGKTIWTGRVLSENKDFYNQRKITAEGALSFLNDSNQGLRYFKNSTLRGFLNSLLTLHNDKVPSNRGIVLGVVTVIDPEENFQYETNYESTWEALNNQCIDRLGGHIRIRYNQNNDTPILDYLADYPKTAPQEINFGNNLLDFTINWDTSDLATTIIPRGKQLDSENENGQRDYVNIAAVNGGKNYVVNPDAYAAYGRIEKIVDFSDTEDPDFLLQLADNYVNSMQFNEMAMSVNALDLHYLTSEEVSFDLLDEVRCISRPHGLDKLFPISEISIPLDNPAGVSYTMGTNQQSTMSGNSTKTSSKIAKAIRSIIPASAILDQAKAEATEILNQRTTGYVSIIEQEDQAQALVISNRPSWEESTKYWKFDMNGLGYTNDGGNTYGLAITMDGTIVADYIKTGILSDGRGYNFWNLSTGEFSLAQTAQIIDDNGDSIYLNDVVNETRDNTNRRTGAENYLDGSKDWSKWRHAGNWTFDDENAQCASKSSATMGDMLGLPNKSLKYSTVKGYTTCFSFEAVSEDDWGELGANNALLVRFSLVNPNGAVLAKIDRLFSLSVSWVRKYTVLEMVDETFLQNGQSTDLNNAWLTIEFYNKSRHQITLRHIKLERGNTPTDWNVSTVDQDSYAYATAEEAKNAAKTYTDNQKKALDESLNQEGVLKRLTNNYRSKGIWMKDGQLYMNGSYIKTGTLDATIIKAGLLEDAAGKNQWNMVTGYLETTNAVFNNAWVTGDFQSGSYYKIRVKDGKIVGILNGQEVGFIQPTGQSTYIPNNSTWYGLQFQAKDHIRISAPHISVMNSSDTKQTTMTGATTNFQMPYVSKIENMGEGQLRWYNNILEVQVINGLITYIGHN